MHSLDGENLLDGTPLVAWVDLLSIMAGAGDEMEGCVTPGELVGMFCLADAVLFHLMMV